MTKKTEYRLNFIWDYDKEEKWINEMAKEGWRLDNYFFCKYDFVPCEPGEYEYKIQLLDEGRNSSKSRDYIAFLREMDINVVDTWFRWLYLEKKADGEGFEIFSDRNSRLKHINGVLSLIKLVGWTNGVVGVSNVIIALINTLNGVAYGNLNFIGSVNILLAVASYYGAKRLKRMCEDLEATGEVEE